MTYWQCVVTLVSGRTGESRGRIFVFMQKKFNTVEKAAAPLKKKKVLEMGVNYVCQEK